MLIFIYDTQIAMVTARLESDKLNAERDVQKQKRDKAALENELMVWKTKRMDESQFSEAFRREVLKKQEAEAKHSLLLDKSDVCSIMGYTLYADIGDFFRERCPCLRGTGLNVLWATGGVLYIK